MVDGQSISLRQQVGEVVCWVFSVKIAFRISQSLNRLSNSKALQPERGWSRAATNAQAEAHRNVPCRTVASDPLRSGTLRAPSRTGFDGPPSRWLESMP